VVANANRKDDYHLRCVDLLQNFPGPLLLPAPLLAEIGYMLFSRAGAKAEADYGQALTQWRERRSACAVVGFGLADPAPQGLLVDARIPGDMRDRTA
jgi:hypothetical protein